MLSSFGDIGLAGLGVVVLLKAAAASLAVSDTFPMLPEWPEVASSIEVAISNIAGGADTKTEMDKAAKEVKAIMKRSGY